MPSLKVDTSLLNKVAQLAESAGELIMQIYLRDSGFTTLKKSDSSPLTEADLSAHRHLLEGLSALTPDIPILSEEGDLPPFSIRHQWRQYWLIDPLDGTKEFISRNGEFTVNIALIDNHQSVLGVVYAPALNVLYKAINQGLSYDCAMKIDCNRSSGPIEPEQKAVCKLIKTSSIGSRLDKNIRVLTSRHHGAGLVQALSEEIQAQFGPVMTSARGSSLKLCEVAESAADLYPRFGPTSEWDTAAAQAIVEAAGGAVLDTQLQPLRYNTTDSVLNPSFYVVGDKPEHNDAHFSAGLSSTGQWLSLLRQFGRSQS